MYAIVINNKVEIGPRDWNYSIFAKQLKEKELPYDELPKAKPKTSIITDNWKLLPINIINKPTHDAIYEQLEGPTYTIKEDGIDLSYKVVPETLAVAKSKLSTKVTEDRYKVEVNGIGFTFADATEVTLYTTREDRNTYLDALLTVPDGINVKFKFKDGIFKEVTKAELQQIVNTIMTHIQSAFEWEATKLVEIDNCLTLEELKQLDLVHPNLVITEEQPA